MIYSPLVDLSAAPNLGRKTILYMQAGKQVTSLGVHEHWDSDETRRYSRNLDQKNGVGIELIYTKIG